MGWRATLITLLFALTLLIPAAHAQGPLTLYCSSPNTSWCQGLAIGFEKSTGTRVAVIQKATGEIFAQIKAEEENPRGDVWWAGPSDAYMQAAEEGLLETYRSIELRPDAHDGLPATVKKAAYLGGTMEYTLLTPLGELFAISQAVDAPLAPGQMLGITLLNHGVVLVPRT